MNYLATKFSLTAALGYAAIYAELFGGASIALVFLLRPSAFFALTTMLVAAFYARGDDPFSQKELSLLYAASPVARSDILPDSLGNKFRKFLAHKI